MSNFNPYLDPKVYSGHMDMQSETIPTNPSYHTVEGEKCLCTEDNTVPFPTVLHNVGSGNITAFDKKVISLLATFTFMSSRQLTECLTLLKAEGVHNLKSSLERLKRNQMIRSFRFGTDDQRISNSQVHTLNKNGSELAKVLGISHNFSPFAIGMHPSEIKRMLAANQIMNAFLKSGMKLDWMKRGQVINSRTDKSSVVRPSFTVSADGTVLMYEVVRRGEFWREYLVDKLKRYCLVFDSWADNSWDIAEQPMLIMNGENEAHNREIAELAKQAGVQVLFTEDLLLFGSMFFQSIYAFDAAGNRQFYRFQMKEGAA